MKQNPVMDGRFHYKTKKPSEVEPHIASILKQLPEVDYWKAKETPFELLFIKFVRDQGNEFQGPVAKLLEKYQNISVLYAIPKVRRSGTIVERFNGTILSALKRAFIATKSENWTDILPTIIKSYNNRYHSSTQTKPIVLLNLGTPRFIRRRRGMD